MDCENIRLVAFDLDGTLTQHKSPLEEQNRAVLDALRGRYRLLMVGAGSCERIFNQLGRYPIDVIGNYGMQYAKYDSKSGELKIAENFHLPCERESVERRAAQLREKYGFTEFSGDSVQYHESGCVTIALLGTQANLADKLAFDPDRSRRRAVYDYVVGLFPDYNVFIGGSSSFDMSPAPYQKAYALGRYCEEYGLSHAQVAYVGDDYGPGGNDEPIYKSDFNFIKIDDYRSLPQVMRPLL